MSEETKVNGFSYVFESLPDLNAMTAEEEADYWNGIGFLEVMILQNWKSKDEERIFEFEVIDYNGCVGGIEEAIGIDYLLTQIWCLQDVLKEGYIYRFTGITALWTRGDGWSTDDDVDYYFGALSYKLKLWPWFKTKIAATWWKHIGWRLSK